MSPIDPMDIRKGDKIRGEFHSFIDGNDGAIAHEFVARRDGLVQLEGASEATGPLGKYVDYYLLERPAAPVTVRREDFRRLEQEARIATRAFADKKDPAAKLWEAAWSLIDNADLGADS